MERDKKKNEERHEERCRETGRRMEKGMKKDCEKEEERCMEMGRRKDGETEGKM